MPNDEQTDYEFPGFHSPNYTPVPDELFDELLARLSGSELKVLLYVIRRTFGFKKASDNISLSQMLNGITTEEGRVLDQGAGIKDRKTLLEAINKLEAKKILVTQRRSSAARGNEPTIYRLNVRSSGDEGKTSSPLAGKPHQGVDGETPPSPWRGNPTTQETEKQKTDLSFEFRKISHDFVDRGDETGEPPTAPEDRPHRASGNMMALGDVVAMRRRQTEHAPAESLQSDRSEPSPSRRGRPEAASEDREHLAAYLCDFAKELHDGAPLSSTITRVHVLFQQARMPRERWGDLLYQARAITHEHSAQITTPAGAGLRGAKNKMPYYLAVLEDLLGLKPSSAVSPDISQKYPSDI